MHKLIQGIHHFQNKLFGSKRELFERLAKGQSPEVLFITCSDSRINPNLLTQTEPGELFILRNAGNIVPPYDTVIGGEAATIEFAVAGLGVKDIVICGHSHCGAMSGLLDPTSIQTLPALNHWLTHAQTTRKIVHDKYPEMTGPELLMTAIQENVLAQMENLRTHPVIAASLASGKIKLHGWVYRIETGEIFGYDPKICQFMLLNDQRSTFSLSDRQLIPADI